MPKSPLCFTSTLPAVVLAGLRLTRRTEAAGGGRGQGGARSVGGASPRK